MPAIQMIGWVDVWVKGYMMDMKPTSTPSPHTHTHTRDRKRVELSNDSVRFDSIRLNRIESNWKFEKVGRIESNRIEY